MSVKPPVWTWEIPAYFFVGGVAGVAAVIAGIGALAGADAALVRDARWVAAAGAAISPALLISDLGRPERFLNMLRVFKRRSPMSVGVWSLVAFSGAVFASLALSWWRDPAASPAIVTAAAVALDVAGIVFGLVLATYTGVLLGVTSVPVWARHAQILPVHFGASSLGAGVAVLELVGHRTPSLHAIAIAAAIVETIIGIRLEMRRELTSSALGKGAASVLTRLGDAGSGPVALVLRVVAPYWAGLAAIAGSICTRYGWLAAGRQSAGGQDLSLFQSLVDRAAAYVRDYQEKLRFVLADEEYHQAVFDPAGRQTASRTLTGELFLAFVPGDAKWIAVHDVRRVDGVPVTDGEDLRKLLEAGEVTPVARRVAERNAKYNVGSVRRNFNEPTLPLLLLGAERRRGVSFERGGVRRDADSTIATLTFRERERPTLVMTERGQPVYARGDMSVDTATGVIHRTRFLLRDGDLEVELHTDYVLEPRLDLWVPSRFTERYDALGDRRRREQILCESTYTNYRRFDVRGRIK